MAYKIVIDGVIGGWEIDGRFIRNELEKAEGKDLLVEIASPGGFVFDGIEIFNLFKNYPGFVHMHIIGLAASMASYIPLAGDKITAEENAVFMIHNVWTFAFGDHRDFEKEIKILKGLTNILAKSYASKTGKSLKEINNLMNEETFFFGNEIIDNGFIDELIPVEKKVDSKDDSLAFAKLQIEDCFSKMKEKQNKDDIQKAAAWLKIEPENNIEIILEDTENFNKPDSKNFNNKPAESGKREGSMTITLEQLKNENLDLYNTVKDTGKQAGIDQERIRTAAHIAWIETSKEAVLASIKNGDEFSPASLSIYTQASLNMKMVTDSISENPGSVSTETPLEDEKQKETDLLNQTMALSKKTGGK